MKQQFLQSARDMGKNMSDSVEKEFTTALLYMNLADYLAEYMVVSFNAMLSESMSKYYLGVVKVRPPKRDKLTIGESINQLQRFDFAGKAEIIEKLTAINKARQKIAHQILKTKPENMDEIDEAARDLVSNTEELVELVDTLSLGMPPRTIVDKLNPATVPDDLKDEVEKASEKKTSK